MKYVVHYSMTKRNLSPLFRQKNKFRLQFISLFAADDLFDFIVQIFFVLHGIPLRKTVVR